MKKINIIFIILVVLLSCSKDFLDVSPYNRKVVGNFYKTPADALEALVAAYDPLRWGYSEHIILISEIASDNCFGGAGASDDQRLQRWDDFVNTPFSNAEPWTKYYTGIYRANVFLEHADNVEWGAEIDLKNKEIAECRFLRAFYYFDLVRIYGNVPLVTKVLTVDELNVPQADPVDVYKFITEDLLFAIENLPDIPYTGPNAESGRVTKWAAEALLGRVFLYYTGYYGESDLVGLVTKADARNYIDDIINNSGHGLVPNFAYLWKQALENFVGEDNLETVFGIKCTYKGMGNTRLNYGNRFQVMVGIRTISIPPYAVGWGAATVNPKLWNDYVVGDTRKDATIIDMEKIYYLDLNNDTVRFNPSDQREYTGYNWKKFVPTAVRNANGSVTPTTVSLGGNYMLDNPDDYPVIRFADVLLMGAELHLDDNLGLAQTYFDLIRDRAFLDNLHRIALSNDEAGINAIMEERRFELALEGHRYWDLLRHGGLKDNLAVAKQAIDCDTPYYVRFRPETLGLQVLPETQITLSNGLLKQNPGWEQ